MSRLGDSGGSAAGGRRVVRAARAGSRAADAADAAALASAFAADREALAADAAALEGMAARKETGCASTHNSRGGLAAGPVEASERPDGRGAR